jgi:hypothetical protein
MLTVQVINVHFAIGRLWIPKDIVIVTNIAAYVVVIINRMPQEVIHHSYQLILISRVRI